MLKQIQKLNIKKNNSGFTLVETLVAISILSISILGTFTAVQSGLSTSGFAKDQVTAFYLVQEGMESVRNVRDQNALENIANPPVDWLSDPINSCIDKTCAVDSPAGTMQVCGVGGQNGWGSCPYLNQNSDSGLFGYSSDSGWTTSRFKREIQIQKINNNEILVAIAVFWKSGAFTKKVQVRESLFNIR